MRHDMRSAQYLLLFGPKALERISCVLYIWIGYSPLLCEGDLFRNNNSLEPGSRFRCFIKCFLLALQDGLLAGDLERISNMKVLMSKLFFFDCANAILLNEHLGKASQQPCDRHAGALFLKQEAQIADDVARNQRCKRLSSTKLNLQCITMAIPASEGRPNHSVPSSEIFQNPLCRRSFL